MNCWINWTIAQFKGTTDTKERIGLLSGFQMIVEKPKPKQLLRPITTRAGSAMSQSKFLAITCNSLEVREKSRVRGAIGFGFASHWLKFQKLARLF